MQGQFTLSDLTQWWGRAGRDGKPAVVHWFVDDNYINNNYISYELKFVLHKAMNDKVCIRSLLLSYFRFNDEQLVPDSVPSQTHLRACVAQSVLRTNHWIGVVFIFTVY